MSSESHQACLDGRVAIEMDEVNRKMDPMGRAILDYFKRQGRAADYHKTGTADKLRVFSPMFEEDELPLATLFRKNPRRIRIHCHDREDAATKEHSSGHRSAECRHTVSAIGANIQRQNDPCHERVRSPVLIRYFLLRQGCYAEYGLRYVLGQNYYNIMCFIG